VTGHVKDQKAIEQQTSAATLQPLNEQVSDQVRRMGAQSVMTSQAVAARFGLHTTDLECLDLIFMHGQVTAGELAKAVGLTSGAVTALIDRLERAGYVARAADPGDRRRILVRVRPDAIKPIQSVYEPMQQKMFELYSSFSEEQLRIVIHFLARSTDLAAACTEDISTGAPGTTKRLPARAARTQIRS
jgi:DNA-binding MarR family transcriptional regulator